MTIKVIDYSAAPNKCINCGISIIDFKKRHNKFCTQSCSATYNNKKRILTDITKLKISNSLKQKHIHKPITLLHKVCNECTLDFYTKKVKQIFCSKSCARKSNWRIFQSKALSITSEEWSKIHKRAFVAGKKKISGGTTKWYTVNTSKGYIKVQGTYEVRVCNILDHWKNLNKIYDWEYTNDRYPYVDINNKRRTYLIDFKVYIDSDDFYYLEVKGYSNDNDINKWNAVRNLGYRLDVWYYEDIITNERCISPLPDMQELR